MATKKLYILDNPDVGADGLIKTREKVEVGEAWNREGPNQMYIECNLINHWIITEEEYNKLKLCNSKT